MAGHGTSDDDGAVPSKPAVNRRRPTINDVAEHAGASRSTTARALSGNGYVAADVRDRVQAAAEELGYVADAVASSLRAHKSHSIGVLVSDLRNPFYASLASGIGRRAREHGYTMILVDDRGSVTEELEAAKVFVGMRVGGVIVTPLSAGITTYLAGQGIPVVEADRTFTKGKGDAVLIDNVGASRRLVDLLVALGHRRVALLSDERDWTTGADRFAGYRAALAEASIEVDESLVVSSESTVEDARRAAVDLLTRKQPTAVFAVNNVLAEGVWRASADLGLTVPADLSIVSFDDAPWMTMVTPGVTAVAQDVVALGEAAMVRLLERMDAPETPQKTVVVDAEVLARGSTAAPRQPRNPPAS